MPVTRRTALLAALALLVAGCGSEPPAPDTGVDLTTPVVELAGWADLITGLSLPSGRDDALASWVVTFREGLDISRRIRDSGDRTRAEADWWAEARTSLVAIVGAANVDAVVAWLETLYGDRGGTA